MSKTEEVKYTSQKTCEKCKSGKVTYQVVTSYDGAYDDCRYTCEECYYTWWVDGIDS